MPPSSGGLIIINWLAMQQQRMEHPTHETMMMVMSIDVY
jgi:hypothetical protein